MSHPFQRQPLLDELALEGPVLAHPSLLTRPLHELWDGNVLAGLMATQGQVLETDATLYLTLHFEMAFVREPWRRQGLAKEMVRAAAGEALALVEGRIPWLRASGRSVEVTLGSNDGSPAGQALFDIAEELIDLAEDDAMMSGVDFTLLSTRGF
jgi:GNAT superfamily N-acetyltransferase